MTLAPTMLLLSGKLLLWLMLSVWLFVTAKQHALRRLANPGRAQSALTRAPLSLLLLLLPVGSLMLPGGHVMLP